MQNCFHQNFVNFPLNLIIVGTQIVQWIDLCEVHLFSTSPDSRQRPTVLNTDVPLLHSAVIISNRLVTFASTFRQRAPRDLVVL